MTDEEMAYKHAEEYIMREDVITENDRVPFDNGYGFQTVSFEDEVKKGYKDGFLAGLKAGRPQWHKVAAGDLPEKEDVFLIYTTKGFLLGHYEQGGADGKVDYCGEPYSDFTEYPSEEELVANEVIAWCEIPKFEEAAE